MSGSTPSHRWMQTLLDLLYLEYDRAQAMRMLQDEQARAEAVSVLERRLEDAGMASGLLDTDPGRNLFVAVLTLRLKFPIEEAREKVRLNIAMREGRA